MLGAGAPEQREEVTKLRTGGRSHLAGGKVRDPGKGEKGGQADNLAVGDRRLEACAG